MTKKEFQNIVREHPGCYLKLEREWYCAGRIMIVDYDKPFINECGQRKFHLIIQNFHRKQEKWSSEAEYSAQLPCQKAYAKYAEWWLEIEEKL